MNPRRPERLAPITRALLALLLATLASDTLARSSDRQQEAEILAGHWVDDPEKGYIVFSEDVVLTQGTLRITADRATVYRGEKGGFRRIVLEGTPARWEEEMDDGLPMKARAARIDYAVEDERVVLEDDVVVNKARDEITGDLIRYNLATQRLDAGEESDGRVRIRFTPTTGGEDDGDGS